MSESDLNRYFFDALRQVLNLSTTTYVTGARIWFYELPWSSHQVTRPGYFFFGPPDERTTAQPPRDFYVYFLPPFDLRTYYDAKLADEVIFRLTGAGDDFRAIVRSYAGAQALASDSPTHRQVYLERADETLKRRLLPWLREHLLERLQVIHQGVEKPARAVLPALPSSESPSLADLLNRAAAHLLAPAFDERYPDYPRFTKAQQPITENTRATAATEALRGILSGRPTRLGEAVLHGLQLLGVDGRVRPQESPYAAHFRAALYSRPEGQVTPRGDVLEKVAESISGPIYKDLHFSLEPEWVAVLLAALVYNGDIVLALPGGKSLEADGLERYNLTGPDELAGFLHYARPRNLPLSLWKEIFTVLGLKPGLIQDEGKRDQAVEELQKKVQAELETVTPLENRLQGLSLWNEAIFADRPTFVSQGGVVVSTETSAPSLSSINLLPALRGYKSFLENLARVNTAGKLRNLKTSPADLADLRDWQAGVRRVQTLLDAVNELRSLSEYLSSAEAYLPADQPWQQQAAVRRQQTLETLRRLAHAEAATTDVIALRRDLEDLKRAYVAAYAAEHRRLALGPGDDARRQQIYADARRKTLTALKQVDLLRENADQLRVWEEGISELRVCRDFHEGVLDKSPICPHCKLNPAAMHSGVAAAVRLDQLDARLSGLLTQWRQALHAALTSEQAQASLAAMTTTEKRPVEAFLQQAHEDAGLPAGFVDAANRALRGIHAVRLATADLLAALQAGGLPCTVDEFRARFNRILQQTLRGHDEANTRLTLDGAPGEQTGKI